MKKLFLAGIGSLIASSAAFADGLSHPNHHAPIGVMGDHTHKQGEWMTSYRYSYMHMDGNRDGTNRMSSAAVISSGFMVAPLEMDMHMHMFGLMYGATDNLTLTAMAPYVIKTMDHVNMGGIRFSTRTQGLGDIKLGGLYRLNDLIGLDSDRHKLHINFGLSTPTGSIDERDDTPAGQDRKLPYPMQLGSGTVDPLLGLTYTHLFGPWSFGGQANTVLRFGENDEGYRLGNEFGLTAFANRNLGHNLSLSFRLDGKAWGDIHGQDSDLNPNMVPTARTDLRGGRRVDALVGLNLLAPHDGMLKNHRLAAEFGMPVYQHLDGPQLETDYRLTVGWQFAF